MGEIFVLTHAKAKAMLIFSLLLSLVFFVIVNMHKKSKCALNIRLFAQYALKIV